jgi:amino acid adenylation domain-containing protein
VKDESMNKDRAEQLRRRVALRSRPPAPRTPLAAGATRPDSVLTRAAHLGEAFAAVVAEFPDRIAVQDGRLSWTYRQLDETADRLAAALRAVTSDPGRPVGILLERSVWMVAAALAVLRTGSSYAPLDAQTPRARLELIVDDAEPAAVITSRAFAGRVPGGLPAVFVDDPLPEPGADAPQTGIDRDTRAYIIFTSGTTGRPKGVQVSHGNLLSLFAAVEETYAFGAEDVWTQFHSFSFDFSVWEMWGALLHGGRLVVVPARTAQDPAALWRLLRDERITVLCQTPTAFHQLAAEDNRFADRLPLRWVVFGGEPLYFSDLAPWFAKYGDDSPRLLNAYGITETTVISSFHRVTQDQLGGTGSLIGRPIAGTEFLLVDDALSAVPPGGTGEIVVTGPGVGLGYLKRPELDRDRFVELPGGRGRGYRSGDLARLTPSGVFAYHGRKDDQVKIRGFRIELGEIEQALRALPLLAEAAVVARDLPERGTSLVAYVVPAEEAGLSVESLQEALAATLPGYMVPTVFVRLDRLPLTQNGKADRKALPDPADASTLTLRGTGRGEEPADAVEERVLRIVTGLLHLDRADPTAGFFDLGGHSLLATRLLAGVRTAFDVEVPLREFLREPTARALAAVVRERLAEPSRDSDRAAGIGREPGHDATPGPAGESGRPPTRPGGDTGAAPAPPAHAGRPTGPVHAVHTARNTHGGHPALLRLRQHPAGAPPVFALPGVLGLGESFAQLSSHFRDRSFSALSTARLVRASDGEQTATALAEECARIIAAAVDGGPLHLVGHSYGGSLGFYVAGRLRELGVPVAGLVLLDALDPAALEKKLSGGHDDQLLAFLATLAGLFPDLARHRDTDLPELLRTESTAMVLARAARIIGPSAVEFFQGGLEAAFRTYRWMCDRSWPEPRPAGLPTLFVRAGGEDGAAGADHPSEWARLLPGALRVERVEADHEGMLRNPHARRLAELLQGFLTEHDVPHETGTSGTQSAPGKGATPR